MNWISKLEELGLVTLEGDRFAPLSEMEVQKLESIFGGKFPEDYRLFLLSYGASDFEESAVFRHQDGGVYLGTFFGQDLKKAMADFYGDRLPKLIIPINDDGASNLICISLRPEDFGAIYFQHHSIGWEGEDPSDEDAARSTTLFRLADSFTSFICDLEIDP
jgi:hypothetical protein